MRKIILGLIYGGFFILLSIVVAEGESRDIILNPVYKDIPNFERIKDQANGQKYPLKMIKTTNYPLIVAPPQTEDIVLFFGLVKLGVPVKDYGILVDFEGTDKKIWVDSNGDGDFSSEKPYEIFKSDRFPGVNVYYSPTPLTFQAKYVFADHTYQIPLQLDLTYLFIARSSFSDCFFLKNRTWFTGTIAEGDEELGLALVDTNDNGIYNDPKDLILIDKDYDLSFSQKGSTIKECREIKMKSKKRFKIDYQYAPEKIIYNN